MPPNDDDVRRLLAINAYLVWELSLTADRWSRRYALYDRMEHPIVGDLVLETSAFRLSPFNGAGLGELLAVDDEAHGDTQWTIRDLNGDTHRWHDCHFIAVPNCITVDPISFYPEKQIGLPR